MVARTAWRSFAIGVTCGLRSMTGPAVARWAVHDPLRLGFAALAAGELIADKLPVTPARTIAPALVFRMIAGGFAGRTVALAFGRDPLAGTIAGSAGAILGAYGGLAVRREIDASTGLPDPIVALIEDAIAVYGAIAAARKPFRE